MRTDGWGRTSQTGNGEELSGAARGTTSALAAGRQGGPAAWPSLAFVSGPAWKKLEPGRLGRGKTWSEELRALPF